MKTVKKLLFSYKDLKEVFTDNLIPLAPSDHLAVVLTERQDTGHKALENKLKINEKNKWIGGRNENHKWGGDLDLDFICLGSRHHCLPPLRGTHLTLQPGFRLLSDKGISRAGGKLQVHEMNKILNYYLNLQYKCTMQEFIHRLY